MSPDLITALKLLFSDLAEGLRQIITYHINMFYEKHEYCRAIQPFYERKI